MASTEDDSDLEALRLAVLASLKTRPQVNSQENERPPRPDAELENLRSAALHSKRDQDDHFNTSRNLSNRGFPQSRGYRRDFSQLRNRVNANLIVIQPVPIEENSQQSVLKSTSTSLVRPQDRYCSALNEDDASQSPRQQKTNRAGKFSRFQSDSSGDDSSESEFSESEEAKSLESSEGSEKKSEEESGNEENTNEDDDEDVDDILLLHAEDQLQDGEQLLDCNGEDETLINKETEQSLDTKITEETSLSEAGRNVSSDNKAFSDSDRTKGDNSGAVTNGVGRKLKSRVSRRNTDSQQHNRSKEDKERRNRPKSKDRLKTRIQQDVKEGRSGHRGDNEKKDRRTSHATRIKRHENDEGRRKRRDRHEITAKSDKIQPVVRDKHHRKDEEKPKDAKVDKSGIELEPNNRKNRTAVDVGELKLRHNRVHNEEPQNTRPVSKTRSPSPSSKSQPVWPSDLRQKLKLRSSKNDVINDGDGPKKSGHSQRDNGKGSSEEESSSGRVKSVLGIVKLSSSEPKVKKSPQAVRSKLAPRPLMEKIAKKPNSPLQYDGDQSPRARKVLLVKEGKCFSDDDNRRSRRTKINITLKEAALENEEVCSKQRVPVRLRLGNLPKSSKQTSKPDPVQISHHHHSDRGYRSSSPSFVSKPTSKKRASPADADTDDPPRKVKLKRDAFLSTAKLSSSSKINGFPAKKIDNESGKTYENELDEKIRRIRAKNQAIMKRKCEIAEDEQVNY